MTLLKKTQEIAVIAHDIRSLHNVGSLFRSCDAFGVERLYLTGITGTPPRHEIAKVALGSECRVAWEYRASVLGLMEELRREGMTIVALETGVGSSLIEAYVPTARTALIIGNEVEGIPQDVLRACDVRVEISMRGTNGRSTFLLLQGLRCLL